MRPSLDHHRSIALVDELWPILKILETRSHVVEQLAIGEIDCARGSRGGDERRHVVENQAKIALGGAGRLLGDVSVVDVSHRPTPSGQATGGIMKGLSAEQE